MTPEQKAAFINAQAAILNAQIAGMVSENMNRANRGEALAYTEDDFTKLIDASCLGHNNVVGFFAP